MNQTTKIEFRHRRIQQIEDITDLVDMLFPGNRNQQHAAAQILLTLKAADGLVPSLGHLETRCGISRRTLQRARAKLSRLGLIERVTWMNTRHHGSQGWKLSGRITTALRGLAQRIEHWVKDRSTVRADKDKQLVSLLSSMA